MKWRNSRTLLARASGVAPEHAGHVSGFYAARARHVAQFVVSAVVVALFLTRMATALEGATANSAPPAKRR